MGKCAIARVCALAVAVFLLSAAGVRAELIIDQFNSPDDQSIKATVKSPSPDSSLACSAIGGYRDLLLQEVAGQPIYLEALDEFDGGGLYFTQGTGQAVATIGWYGPPGGPAYNLGGQDLTEAGKDNSFSLDVADVTGEGINVTMTVYTNSGRSSATDPVWVTSPGIISLPYSSFINAGAGGAANFADVDAITLTLNGTGLAGSDINITSLASVPEPSTLVLVVAALVFVGAGRRWKKAG